MSQSSERPLWQEEALQALADWWRLIAIALAAALLWWGLAAPPVGAIEARVLMVVFPLGVLTWAAVVLRDTRGVIFGLGLALALAAAAAAETRVAQVLLPPEPYATAVVGPGAPDATLAVPDDVQALRMTVHGELGGSASSASLGYALQLERNQVQRYVHGELSRQTQSGQRSRLGPQSSPVTVHETETHDLALPGPGSVRVHFRARGDERGDERVHVAIAAAPSAVPVLERGLVMAVAIAVVLQALAARRRWRAAVAPPMAVLAVFVLTVSRAFNPDDPLKFTMGALLFGLLGGGAAGWLLGALSARLARPREAAVVPPPAR